MITPIKIRGILNNCPIDIKLNNKPRWVSGSLRNSIKVLKIP